MRTDYEILGLQENASQAEIKRAYFRLIRQYTPEKDPERFQEIRRAYENLKEDGKSDAVKVNLEVPDDELARKLLEQIEKAYTKKRFGEVLGVAQEAVRVFGEYSGFLYFLGIAQRMTGSTGKSVRTFEKLVQKHPQEKKFQGELAISYQERGYGKKAFAAFEKAYDMGYRNLDFMTLFGICCQERKNYVRGLQIVEESIEAAKKRHPRPLPDLVNLFTGGMTLGMQISDESFLKMEKAYETFLYDTGSGLESVEEMLWESLNAVGAAAVSCCRDTRIPMERSPKLKVSFKTAKEGIFGLLKAAEEVLPDSVEEWKRLRWRLSIVSIQNEPGLSEAVKGVFLAFDREEEWPQEDAQYGRFIQLDAKLCLIEEWPRVQKELELVKKLYPEAYASVEEVFQQIARTKDPDRLRDMLLKDYTRLEQYYEGCYFERYPQRRPVKEKQTWDSEMEGTFRRTGKKIGRNDPCPCGSGKKYKNCCGRGIS